MLEFRNVRTHEYRKVEEGSDEHLAMLEERRATDLRPAWEQVGRHTRQAAEQRAETGVIVMEDLGADERVANTGENSVREKRKQLPDLRPSGEVSRATPSPAELKDGEGRAAEDYDTEEDNVSASTRDASLGKYSSWDKSRLQEEADDRELDVEGTGRDGNVTKRDLVGALKKSDQDGQDDEGNKVGEQDRAIPVENTV